MNKYTKIIKTLLLLTTISSVIVWFYPMETYKKFGTISWSILMVVMFIRPLKDIFPKCKLFSFLLKFRREMGILVGIFGIAHTLGFARMMDYGMLGLFQDEFIWRVQGMLFWGMLAFLVSIPLLITSNGISTKILGKKWKTLQRLSYFMFFLVAMHIFMLKKDPAPLVIFTIWLGLFVGALVKNKKSLQNSSTGPKWLCVPCGYIYDETLGDPDSGIAPGTKFEDIPADWRCPVCGVGKADFVLVEGDVVLNDAKIVVIEHLTEDVIELQVDLEKEYSYVPGQFLTFAFQDKGGDFNRSYSIANKVGNVFTFLIKMKKDGRAGQIFPTLKVGDTMKFSMISGTFQLLANNNPKVYIATGTGLAPIYAMLLNTPEEVVKKIYFGVATKKDLFYLDKLKNFKNLEIKVCVSREEVEGCHFGRIDLKDETFQLNTEFYLCGNPGVIEATKNILNAKGFTQVFSEEF